MSASAPCDPTLLCSVRERAAVAGLQISLRVLENSVRYIELLRRWNHRINLTALPLDSPVSDTSIDKLIIEPLVAAPFLHASDRVWFDLGSGGGSPAIPLRLAHSTANLTMVETRSRKCAFLREAVRVLSLTDTTVLEARFEGLGATARGKVDVVTLRAVRIDTAVLELLSQLLKPGGRAFMFGASIESSDKLALESETCLPDGSALRVFERV